MKKILLTALTVATLFSASAEGYQVNTLSAKQLGMGHVGVAQKLNSESMWYNPAGAAFQEQKLTMSASFTGIMATSTWTEANDYSGSPLTTHESDNSLSTPMSVSINYKVTDNLSFGVLFNTPYGSSMNWGDSWAGSHLVQSINLSAYNAQPTISYKFLDGKLSVGVGLMMTWGTFELSRSLIDLDSNQTLVDGLQAAASAYEQSSPETAATYNAYADVIEGVGYNPLAEATLSGDAGLKLGVNIGIMYNFHKNWTLGLSYRSKIDMEVDAGEAELNYASSSVESILTGLAQVGMVSDIPAINTGTFSASLPLPATLSAGLSYRPTERWELATEIQWVQWSAYDVLSVKFNDPSLDGYSIDADKKYSDTIMARFGAQYVTTDWLTTRVGLYVDQSPVASDYLNPETPSMTKVGYTCGASIMPFSKCKDFSVDLAYCYVSSADPERMGSYPVEDSSPFVGNYTTKAHVFSVGLSYGF